MATIQEARPELIPQKLSCSPIPKIKPENESGTCGHSFMKELPIQM
jgi:hypothetical protein